VLIAERATGSDISILIGAPKTVAALRAKVARRKVEAEEIIV